MRHWNQVNFDAHSKYELIMIHWRKDQVNVDPNAKPKLF